MKIDAAQCAARLAANDRFLLLCHRDPDGDTYGCAAALAAALADAGKRVRIECPDEIPENLSFLLRPYGDFEPDYVVALDIASPNMLGDGALQARRVDLCIDHHPTNPDYAAETFLVDYAATGEAVFEILRRMGAPITPFIATALFTALSSDTGGFRFANTTAQTHRYAADLMELGADVEQVRIRLFESHSRGRVKLESDAMANMRYYRGGEIAVISISLAAFAETGIHESEIEGLAAEPLKIDGVHIGITLKERDNGSIRISMRSDSDRYNVAEICARFSGGGHVRAAGCRIWDTLENAEKQLISACEQALDR